MARSFGLRPTWPARLAAAALIALGAHALAPEAGAGEAEAGGTCPAATQREQLASTPAKLEEIQKRIAAQAKPGQKIVVLSNGGYSYGAPQQGSDAALLEYEAKQHEAAPALR